MDKELVKHAEVQVEEPVGLWARCAQLLQEQVPEAAWQSTVSRISAKSYDGVVLVLAVPNNVVRDRVETRYLDDIDRCLATISGTRPDVQIVIERDEELGEPEVFRMEPAPVMAPAPVAPPAPTVTISRESASVPLDPRFTFETFVTAGSNRMAQATAQAVAETPGRTYNPLFIYGDSGLGKTHLLHAIGNYVQENFPLRKILYVTLETFMNDFVDSLRMNTTISFKRRYRECDVLLIDDVQFMQNKEGLQEEFFHTFNDLHGSGKQLVLTSDRPPKSIQTLEDRLRSRFLSGLITQIDPPDLETRIAILRSKAETDREDIPDDVLEFIAAHVKNNIRELEGALIRVSAFASLNSQQATVALAEQVLSDVIASGEPRRVTPKMIIDATARHFGFSVDALVGQSRTRPLVTARQVAMYIVRELTDHSYPTIGREFGNRDHTTVIHAVEKISGQMKERRVIYQQVTDLITELRSGPIE